ncbi:MAG: class I SAM-dependent methyltransferase [Sulfuricella sp.]
MPFDRGFIRRRINQIKQFSATGRSLDVGCGLGEVPRLLSQLGYDAEGLDESSAVINVLSRQAKSVKWHCGTVSEVLPTLGLFDVVTLYHVLEHIPDPIRAVEGILKNVRPGGLLIIEVPNAGGLFTRLMGPRWHYYLDHHVNYFGKRHFYKIATEFGCEVLRIKGDYDFTYPTGRGWKIVVKRMLCMIGFQDVISVVLRKKKMKVMDNFFISNC